jgi:Domain of unknown function (DUF5060)
MTSSTTKIGSVVFTITSKANGAKNRLTENDLPLAVCGNIESDYLQCDANLTYGKTTILATAYTNPRGTGKILKSSAITITILSQEATISPTLAPISTPQNNTPTTTPSKPTNNGVGWYNHGPTGVLTGELRKWHKITIGFDGPITSETAIPNPFLEYRLDVQFVHVATSMVQTIPGYYGANGNAANTSASDGNVWIVHYSPNQIGTYQWTAYFKKGTNISVADVVGTDSAGYFDGMTGSFNVLPTDKTGRDFRSQGRLQYVGEHYLRFNETGQYFFKAGADSPENFLAYDDFDNTPNNGLRRKSWLPHVQDFRVRNPTWGVWNGIGQEKGMAIIGAINYLSTMGMNVFSFLTMNIKGDDKNVYPYVSDQVWDRIDVSKTAQWEIVFEHAQSMGMYLHFKLQERENDQMLDGNSPDGTLSVERKLYFRELIARFGHHNALNWNIGEETTNSEVQNKAFIDYIHATDPYNHHKVAHTWPYDKDKVYSKYQIKSRESNPTYSSTWIQYEFY